MHVLTDFIDRSLNQKIKILSIFSLVCLIVFPACAPQNKTQKGGMVGAGGGAAAGALVVI